MLKHSVLTGLYRFAVSRGYVDSSPLPTTAPKLPPQQTPYVYSSEELRRLLDATAILRRGHSGHVPAMYRTLLLLLYGTGMRIGETLRLTLQDVDLTEKVIPVPRTKFFKSRLAPIGPKLADELAAHANAAACIALRVARRSRMVLSARHRDVPACATSCRYQLPDR
jgi:integrase/recombinase XerD